MLGQGNLHVKGTQGLHCTAPWKQGPQGFKCAPAGVPSPTKVWDEAAVAAACMGLACPPANVGLWLDRWARELALPQVGRQGCGAEGGGRGAGATGSSEQQLHEELE